MTTDRAPDAVRLAVLLVRDDDVLAVGDGRGVLDAEHRRAEPDPRRLALAIERGEIHAAVVHALEARCAGDPVGHEPLHEVPRVERELPPGNDCGSGPVCDRTRATPGMPICDDANADTRIRRRRH